MPIYEYFCPSCKVSFEEWVKSASAENSHSCACPTCNSLSERMISPTTFILKGGGWYVTEYKNSSAPQSSTAQSSTQQSSAPQSSAGSQSTPSASSVNACNKNDNKGSDLNSPKATETTAGKTNKATSNANA